VILDARDLDLQIDEADPVAARRAQRYLEQEAAFQNDDPVATVRELIHAKLGRGL